MDPIRYLEPQEASSGIFYDKFAVRHSDLYSREFKINGAVNDKRITIGKVVESGNVEGGAKFCSNGISEGYWKINESRSRVEKRVEGIRR